ncbi:hypothetical protein VQL36_13385 [Chengkuizengella sp. SCS-71B]
MKEANVSKECIEKRRKRIDELIQRVEELSEQSLKRLQDRL